MVPYFLSFTTTYLASWVGEKTIKRNRWFSATCFLVAIIILSALAALRADTIGTDIKTYVLKFFYAARECETFASFLNVYQNEYVEPGYKLFNFIISRFTGNIQILHFCIALFDISFVFAYIWENRDKMSISLGLLVYMTMLYNIGFNAVRQMMAVCVCLYSFNAARDRNWKKYILVMLIAFLFHRSALVLAITYPLAEVFNNKTRQEKNSLIITIIILAIIALNAVNYVVGFSIGIGVFPDKFLHYIGNSFSISRTSVFLFLVPAAATVIVYNKHYYEMDSFNPVLVLFVFLWPIVAQLDSVSDQFGRMAYYFSIANIGIFAQLPLLRKRVGIKSNITIWILITILCLIIYWIINFYIWKTGNTVPYLFRNYR